MIRKVLVANRGEIAARIIEACRQCGVASVAVYSEPDAQAPYLKQADEAYPLGGALATESYLNQAALLEIAGKAQCDAVHPGYGFLAENAEFATAVEQAGMAWIGPTPECIVAMGSKHQARQLAVELGVPVVPGSAILSADDAALAEAASSVGFPLLVKASGGGGGIGMRAVAKPEDLAAAVRATRDLAGKHFSDSAIYLERLVAQPRHIEVQVFGFGDGQAVHLYERDCSIQRRYQKVVEEAPAPNLPEATLEKMRAAALALACGQKYRGAGTVEFLYDTDTGEFYFLEMNTRIQVEHPITEMITGADLVAMQIKLAAGTLAPIEQSALNQHGHAFECRVYAERPAKHFLPSTGVLETFAPPVEGAGVRVDTGYAQGMKVTHLYDPLIAKVITWGETRELAAARMRDALAAFQVSGVETNLGMLQALMSHDAVLNGTPTTQFLSLYPETAVA